MLIHLDVAVLKTLDSKGNGYAEEQIMVSSSQMYWITTTTNKYEEIGHRWLLNLTESSRINGKDQEQLPTHLTKEQISRCDVIVDNSQCFTDLCCQPAVTNQRPNNLFGNFVRDNGNWLNAFTTAFNKMVKSNPGTSFRKPNWQWNY